MEGKITKIKKGGHETMSNKEKTLVKNMDNDGSSSK